MMLGKPSIPVRRPLFLVTVCAGGICWIARAEACASAAGQDCCRYKGEYDDCPATHPPIAPFTSQDSQQTCRESVGAV